MENAIMAAEIVDEQRNNPTSPTSPSDREAHFTANVLSVDLSRKGIARLPSELSSSNILEHLYLEGNQLTSLPDSLFSCYPQLKWLDLRNNKLRVLSPSIEKLRSLRTLLLEGNSLVSLPVQLCRLPFLTGLNISRNPLQNPPKHVIDKGTKAVLSYLRESMNDEGSLSSDSSSTSLADSGRDSKPLKSATGTNIQKATLRLPQPAMKAATLHTQEAHHMKKVSTLGLVPRNKVPRRATQAASKTKPVSQREKQEINKSLDKLKSKQGLEEWRNQAKLKQKLMLRDGREYSYAKATENAPFATDIIKVPSQTDTLEETEPLRGTLKVDQEVVEKYRSRLEDKRKQVGIITDPSSELQEAEKNLAEAMALQEELESRKIREYRLSAFTGDLPY